MVVVSFKRERGYLTEVSAIGHANYAEHGKDIVCSAVSIVLTGLMNEIGNYVKAEHKAASGDMELSIEKPNEKTQVLMDFALNTIRAIAEEYPDNVIVTTK